MESYAIVIDKDDSVILFRFSFTYVPMYVRHGVPHIYGLPVHVPNVFHHFVSMIVNHNAPSFSKDKMLCLCRATLGWAVAAQLCWS